MNLLEQFSQPQREILLKISTILKAKDAEVFLVGGCVRDALIGIKPKDIDIEVYGIEAKTIEALLSDNFKVEAVGKNFGVFILKGHNIDIGIPRRESKIGAKHTEFLIEGDPYMQHKEAALRRDFTINAISFNLIKEEIYDPYNGIKDLEGKILRHVSGAFNEDPLRVLRAMQFVARFGLSVNQNTLKMCQELTLLDLPKERIWEEWKKLILKGAKISLGLQFLDDCGWLKYFKELEALKYCDQDPDWHPEGSVWNHTKLCMDAFAEQKVEDEEEDLIVGLAVLLHDVGKPATTERDEDQRIRSPLHDIKGVAIARSFLSRLTDQKKIADATLPLIREHMHPYSLFLNKAGDAAIRRLASRVKRIDRLIRVVEADQSGRTGVNPDNKATQWLWERAQALEIEKSAPKPIILGRHLINLSLEPSPSFKNILNQCYDAQIEGSFSTEESGIAYLKTLIK